MQDLIKGFEVCPSWLRSKYIEAVKETCQMCNKKSKSLNIHRIKRGNVGGLYTLCPLNHPDNNVKVICSSCHNKIHANEFPNVRSK